MPGDSCMQKRSSGLEENRITLHSQYFGVPNFRGTVHAGHPVSVTLVSLWLAMALDPFSIPDRAEIPADPALHRGQGSREQTSVTEISSRFAMRDETAATGTSHNWAKSVHVHAAATVPQKGKCPSGSLGLNMIARVDHCTETGTQYQMYTQRRISLTK